MNEDTLTMLEQMRDSGDLTLSPSGIRRVIAEVRRWQTRYTRLIDALQNNKEYQLGVADARRQMREALGVNEPH